MQSWRRDQFGHAAQKKKNAEVAAATARYSALSKGNKCFKELILRYSAMPCAIVQDRCAECLKGILGCTIARRLAL